MGWFGNSSVCETCKEEISPSKSYIKQYGYFCTECRKEERIKKERRIAEKGAFILKKNAVIFHCQKGNKKRNCKENRPEEEEKIIN